MHLPGGWAACFISFFSASCWLSLTSGREISEVDFIGHRLVVFTMLRFILEIASCAAVIFTPLNILAYLGGLLTLPAATLGERLVGLIKE